MPKAVWIVSILVGAAALLAGCGGRSNGVLESAIGEYEAALERFPGSEAGIELGLRKFAESYADLTDPGLGRRMADLYADPLFFNDTLHSFHERSALVNYMIRTGAGLSESRVEIRQVMREGPDVFVRWTMAFRTRAAGRDIHSQSIGVTHLRFDEEGRVVLHQDFWDSGHALYAHLPIVGFVVRRARDRM